MRFRWAAAAAVTVSALLLTACTPASVGSMGILRKADGSLEILLRVCHGPMDTLALTPINSSPSDSAFGSDGEEWRSEPRPEVPLSPPVANELDLAMPFDEATLRSDILYQVASWGDGGSIESAQFDAGLLATLRPGEVLSSESLYLEGDAIVMPDEFEHYAAEYCG